MNGRQLTNFLSAQEACQNQFVGIYAADEQPKKVFRRPYFFISNTDVTSGFGKHWVTFLFPGSGPAEFFDSLGRPPEHYHKHFRDYLSDEATSYKFQTLPLQGYGSNTCGLFCLFYALKRCEGWTFEKIIEHFASKSGWRNDEELKLLFNGVM